MGAKRSIHRTAISKVPAGVAQAARFSTLTSRAIPAIKVDVMEVVSMTSLLPPRAAAQLIIAIARMFGKAVKLRHCPATVSAPVFPAVV